LVSKRIISVLCALASASLLCAASYALLLSKWSDMAVSVETALAEYMERQDALSAEIEGLRSDGTLSESAQETETKLGAIRQLDARVAELQERMDDLARDITVIGERLLVMSDDIVTNVDEAPDVIRWNEWDAVYQRARGSADMALQELRRLDRNGIRRRFGSPSRVDVHDEGKQEAWFYWTDGVGEEGAVAVALTFRGQLLATARFDNW